MSWTWAEIRNERERKGNRKARGRGRKGIWRNSRLCVWWCAVLSICLQPLCSPLLSHSTWGPTGHLGLLKTESQSAFQVYRIDETSTVFIPLSLAWPWHCIQLRTRKITLAQRWISSFNFSPWVWDIWDLRAWEPLPDSSFTSSRTDLFLALPRPHMSSCRPAQQQSSFPLLPKPLSHCLSVSSSVPSCHSRKSKKHFLKREQEKGEGRKSEWENPGCDLPRIFVKDENIKMY